MSEPTPIRRKRYGTKDRAKAVTLALSTSVAAASRGTGIPETNIRRWKDDPEMAEYGAKTREEIAEEAKALSVKVLSEIRDRLPTFEPRDLTILYGVLTDKAQLLAGEATSRLEHRELLEQFDDHEKGAVADWLREIVRDRLAADAVTD